MLCAGSAKFSAGLGTCIDARCHKPHHTVFVAKRRELQHELKPTLSMKRTGEAIRLTQPGRSASDKDARQQLSAWKRSAAISSYRQFSRTFFWHTAYTNDYEYLCIIVHMSICRFSCLAARCCKYVIMQAYMLYYSSLSVRNSMCDCVFN